MAERMHRIYDALEKTGALEGYWDVPRYHCFRMYSLELRALMATYAVESQLSNGGPSQLLLHSKPNWRELLEYAAHGYDLMNSANALAEMQKLRKVFEKFEGKFEEFNQIKHLGMAKVGAWFRRMEKGMLKFGELNDLPWDEISSTRDAYLKRNIRRILRELRSVKFEG